MDLYTTLLIAFLSQIPLAIFTIWNGIRRSKPEIRKIQAEEKSSLSDAVEGAGKTLVEAWERIEALESWKTKATQKIDQLESELRKWRNYAARLIKRLKEVDPCGPMPEFETDPAIILKEKVS
ncbi:MAG: hypothetical protein EHM40_03240 [Chloroflexi bacterium]|nr:MAG: hypothetical protein EHM40_03240 [Chloroflexota bacterium]